MPLFRLFGPDNHRQAEQSARHHDIWIVGYHRIGTKVAEVMTDMQANFSVIDFDPNAVKKLRKTGIPFYFGDIADIEFLEGLPIANSQMIIMTIPAIDDQINLINYVRKPGSEILIIGNAYHLSDADILYTHGADFVMMPHYMGGQWISKILRNKEWDVKTLAQLKTEQENMINSDTTKNDQ